MSSESDQPRVLLVGQGPTAHSAYRSLVQRFQVVGMVRSAEPGDELIERASQSGSVIFPDASIAGIRAAIEETKPDAVVVSSFDRILPADLVSQCPFINVHYAQLPQYRGRAVVNWALINGESHTAISIHSLEAELDAGGILFQEQVPIGPRDTITDLYERLNAIQLGALADAVTRRLGGDKGESQDEADATYCCTRLPEDGEIDWSRSTAEIDRLVRALTAPFPGAFTWLGLERVIVHAAEPAPGAPTYSGRVPGRVVRVNKAQGYSDILTGDGVLRVSLVSTRDGGCVPASSVFSSVRHTAGLSLASIADALTGRA